METVETFRNMTWYGLDGKVQVLEGALLHLPS